MAAGELERGRIFPVSERRAPGCARLGGARWRERRRERGIAHKSFQLGFELGVTIEPSVEAFGSREEDEGERGIIGEVPDDAGLIVQGALILFEDPKRGGEARSV